MSSLLVRFITLISFLVPLIQCQILGSSIAGLALAVGLNKKGVLFTIYKREKEFFVVGKLQHCHDFMMVKPPVFDCR
jgi:hypothetical protein